MGVTGYERGLGEGMEGIGIGEGGGDEMEGSDGSDGDAEEIEEGGEGEGVKMLAVWGGGPPEALLVRVRVRRRVLVAHVLPRRRGIPQHLPTS